MSKKKREHVTFDRMATPRRRIGRGGLKGEPPPRRRPTAQPRRPAAPARPRTAPTPGDPTP